MLENNKNISTTVKCDKPYDLDARDRKNGKPRRRRKDPHTTAYELTIRLNPEQHKLLDGKRKFVRHVFAANKKTDLSAQVAEFESHVEDLLTNAMLCRGIAIADMHKVSDVICGYLKSREGVVVSKYVKDSMDLKTRYIDNTIGDVPVEMLTVDDVEKALDAIPDISRALAESKRAAQIRHREELPERVKTEGACPYTHYPEFKPIRVAGAPTQHKVLVLLRCALNWGMDKGFVDENVADAKRLRSQYPKNPPQLDHFHEDEARYVFGKIRELPLSARKVQLQIMFTTGMRPCELCSLEYGNIDLRNPEQGFISIVKHLKTKNAARVIPLDPETTKLLIDWKEERKSFAESAGLAFSDAWLVCCDDGQKVVYNTLKQRWWYFLQKIGVKHRRPYSMRHTFATLNGKDIDVSTLSNLMGHAQPSFTMNVYAGYLASESLPVVARYHDYLCKKGESEDHD